MAAFQALGPFISTFADPGKTGLTFNADGSITVKADAEVLCEPTTSDKPHRTHKHKNKQQDMFMEVDESSGSSSAKIFLTRSSSPPTTESDISEAEKEIAVDENVHMAVGELTFSVEASASETEKPDEKEEFNSFMFWREPLLSVDDEIYTSSTSVTVGDFSDESNDHNSSRDNTETDSDKVQNSCDGDLVEQVSEVHLEPANKCTYEVSKLTGNKVEVKEVGSPLTASVCDVNEDTAKDKKLHTASVNEVNELTETVPNIGSQQVLPQRLNENTMTIVNGITSTQDLLDGTTSEGESEDSSVDDDQWRKQDVIPHDLLENYLSMIDPQRAQTVDTEIAKHCAYSLPGVAFTLGRRNWHCIKDIYETLASDMQWKVRRTLAFSIHEMAVILGDQITSDDLVPVFNGFLKDLDEVRIGVLKHLADFLRLLNKGMRKEYLIRLTDFLQTDNQRNWRFRHELSLQLVALCDLFSPLDVIEYIFPIAITLAGDRVAEVRTLAYKLLSIILKKLRDDNSLHKRFIDDIVNRYAESNRWFGRQTFAHLCQSLLAEESLCEDDFAEELLPHLLELARDNVPNVRLAVSRTLASHVIPSDYFCSKENPKYDALQYVFVQLQEDADRDVRFYMAQSNNMYINFADGDSDEPPV
ncbi:serine/threonine-protein phosphatase 4 regulatory subunit 1-like [Saccoglossus kowalevskii]